LKRFLFVLLGFTLLALACGGRVPPRAPLFPLSPVWEAKLDDFVVPPLAAGARRLFVVTRSGTLHAFNQETGALLWRFEGRPGQVTAGPGRLILREADGTVSSLRVRNGDVRWTTRTPVTGNLPATLDGDRLYVSGRGLAALEVDSGRVIWTQASPADVTAPPASTTARLLVGEEDGTLRCLDRATGISLWTHATGEALRAPPLIDEDRRRIYLGTTDRRILELKLDKGEPGWRWKVGADIAHPGLLLPDRVFFASFDAVLYGLHRGGNLAWRSALPSRPLSGPLLLDDHILIGCHEREILGFDLETGRSEGSLRTVAEIRTGPLLSGRRIFVGLRNRTVVAYRVPEAPPEPRGRRTGRLVPAPGTPTSR
jgi:outer membrane protein assembly factor BamB